MEMLILFRPKVEKGKLTISDEEISLPANSVEQVFRGVPGHVLRHILSGVIKFDGFINPHRVPRPILFKSLASESKPLLLSGVVWGYMENLLVELDTARVRDVRKQLVEYVGRFGEDAVHLALLVHKRPGVRKLVESLPEAAEKARRQAEEEARIKAEEEAKAKAAERARKKAEAEARAKARAEARARAKEERARRQEEAAIPDGAEAAGRAGTEAGRAGPGSPAAVESKPGAAPVPGARANSVAEAVPGPGSGTVSDAGTPASSEAGFEAGSEAGSEAGFEAGSESGSEVGSSVGSDADSETPLPGPVTDADARGGSALDSDPIHPPDSNAAYALDLRPVDELDSSAKSTDSTAAVASADAGAPDDSPETDGGPAGEFPFTPDLLDHGADDVRVGADGVHTAAEDTHPVADGAHTVAEDARTAADDDADFEPAVESNHRIPENGIDHSHCQRAISRLEKEIEHREGLIQNERRRNGKLSDEIGQLREALQQRDKELADLQAKFERQQAKLHAFEQQAGQFARLDEWETRLKARDAALNNMFGDNQQALRDELLQAAMRAHDLEAKHTLLTMALTEAHQRRREALAKAPATEQIPLQVCIDAVRDYIERCGRDAADAATNGDLELAERAAAAEALQRHLGAVKHLAELEPGDEAVTLGDRSTTMNELVAELDAAEVVELSLTGTVFYEGPQAWLRTEEHSLGLPSEFTDEEQLVTGDEVRLHFVHGPDDPFEWHAELLHKADRHEVNDSLRLDEGGFWVQSPEGARLDVSLVEMIRSGIRPDSPVQVQAPAVPLGAVEPVYVRLAKALAMPNVRRPVIGTGRRARRRLERLTPDKLPKVLRGQNVLIVGGDGLESDFIEIAKGMGGQVTWQSGFSEFARVSDRAAKADTVIVVTGRTSHAVANGAAAQARRLNKDIAHFNGLGRSSFVRFLLDTFGDGASDEAAG